MADLTAEYLKQVLHYEPETGKFTWIKRVSTAIQIGDETGSPSGGYLLIRVGDRLYKAHRLAWLYMTGEWPDRKIDHKDTVRDNNTWDNLRLATDAQNSHNTRIFRTNTSGFKGVSKHKASGLWQAYIWVNNKKVSLRYHKTPEAAHAAYSEAAHRLRGEFARVA